MVPPLAGVGRYVQRISEALDALLPSAEFFVYARSGHGIALPSARWVIRNEQRAQLRKIPSFAWLKTRGSLLARRDGLTAFWGGRSLLPRLPASVRLVSTVHDLNLYLVPDSMQVPTRISHRLWFAHDVARAHAVVTNSQGTADRLWHHLGRRADAVARPGVDPAFLAPAQLGQNASPLLAGLGVVGPYLLAVATLEPRKNLALLVQAFVELKQRGELPSHQLVVVGARGWMRSRERALLDAAQRHGVILTGYLDDAAMPEIFRRSALLVCVSSYEGFGMPVAEARASCVPTLIADIPELREAGGPSAHVTALDLGAVKRSILQALRAEPPTERGPEPVPTWEASARKLAQVLAPSHYISLAESPAQPHSPSN
jgi:glycosyltransferase involved in cell wall biosynthesis